RDAPLAQGIDDAAGDLVVAAENAIWNVTTRPEPVNRLVSPGLGPWAMQHGRARPRQSAEGRCAGGHRGETLRAGDMDELATAKVEQMLVGEVPAESVIGD